MSGAMTTPTMFTVIRDAVETLTGPSGATYNVRAFRTSKAGTNEPVVILDDVSIEVETTLTYHCRVWVLIEWDTSVPDTVPQQICELVSGVETYVVYNSDPTISPQSKATFKFLQSEVNQIGQMYKVSVTVEYIEVIELT